MTHLATVDLDGRAFVFRRAAETDLPAIVSLLTEDQLGVLRDGIRDAADLASYVTAFRAIDVDPSHLLLVAEFESAVVGTLQLTFLPGLARRGSWRAQVEAVRVTTELRGQRLGQAMLLWAIDESRRRGCAFVQLTTDKKRADAHRFYARLGFDASHEGMKLTL